ncbi:MAG: hypothetical protein WC728_12320 [Elusimicrobiota bacterium]
MNDDKDEGLYRVVLWTAAVLAAVILYFGGRRLFRAQPPALPSEELAAPRVSSDAVPVRSSVTETPPSVLPPIKLLRVEGKRAGTRHKAVPPAIPQPPIQPDKK